jgi:hypothetical protein
VRDIASDQQRVLPVLLLCLLFSIVSGTKAIEAQAASTHTLAASSGKTPSQSQDSGLPLNFERHTGDLDAMVKAQNIRALVLYSHSSFFYVNGKPEGIFFEALRDFEQFVNQELHTGRQHVQITFIPVLSFIKTSYTRNINDLAPSSIGNVPVRFWA